MGKKELKLAPTVDTLKPYLERALSDSEFRDDLKEALSAARKLYGPLAKEAAKGNGIKSASRLATDAKVQENLRKALEDFGKAAETLKGKKKSHKARKTMLLAGLVAGALYNPWTGPNTRQWLLDKIAGDDDLQPLEGFEMQSGNGDEAASSVAETAGNAGKAAKAAANAEDEAS
jgi:hypothetical protein